MRAPQFNYGDFADQFQGDIWGLTPHFFEGCQVLDIGANCGLVTAFCACNGAFVTAYEPHPTAFEFLQKTIAQNGIQDKVTAINKAVWTETGTTLFDQTNPQAVHYMNSVVSERSIYDYFTAPITIRKREVEAVSFAEAVGDKLWDIVKMDIEGAEYPILLQCPESVFYHIRFLTVETHEQKGTERADLLDRLAKYFTFERTDSIFAVSKIL